MRYRLGKNLGEKGLRSYLKKHLFIISNLAEKVNLSSPALHSYLNNEIDRPRRDVLEKLSSIIDLQFGIDEEGVYFDDEPSDVLVAQEDDEIQDIIDRIEQIKDPRRRELMIEIIKELSDLTPEKMKAIKTILGLI